MCIKTIENKIKKIIEIKGFSNDFVARETNINKNDLCLSLDGKRNFKISEFLNICIFLGLDFKDFESEEN